MKRKNIFITVAYESVLNKIKKTLSKIMVWFVWENREKRRKSVQTPVMVLMQWVMQGLNQQHASNRALIQIRSVHALLSNILPINKILQTQVRSNLQKQLID